MTCFFSVFGGSAGALSAPVSMAACSDILGRCCAEEELGIEGLQLSWRGCN
jgi:hypothetical protein